MRTHLHMCARRIVLTVRSAGLLLIVAGCLTVFALPSQSVSTYQVSISSLGMMQYPDQSKKIVWRTSHWLCTDPVYGMHGTDPNAMPTLVEEIQASDIIIYFKDNDIPDWQWNQLIDTADFWKAKGIRVWLMMAKTILDEPDGTSYSVQHVIEAFKGKIQGVFFNAYMTILPSDATAWLLSKKEQLENNGMECGYYHGDGFSPDYGDPARDVNARYLSNQGLIPVAWLMNDASWKPTTFDLKRFWIDYDILSAEQSAGPAGQSYDEIYRQWYQDIVLTKYNLKNNPGAEALTFMVYTADSWPNPDALEGMIAVANDWLGIT